MDKKHTLSLYILKAILYALVFHNIASVLLFITGGTLIDCATASVLIIPAALLIAARVKAGSTVLFSIIHAALLGLSLLMGANTSQRVIYFSMTLVMCFDSFRIRIKGDGELSHLLSKSCALVFAAAYAVAFGFGYSKLMPLCAFELIAFLALFTVLQGKYKTYTFLCDNKGSANIPDNRINHTSNILLSVFGVLCAVGMAFVSRIPISVPWENVGRAVQSTARFLISLVPNFEKLDFSGVNSGVTLAPAQGEVVWMEPEELSAVAQLIESLCFTIGLVLAIALILFAIGYVIYRMQKRIASNGSGSDIVELAAPDFVSDRLEKIKTYTQRIFSRTTNNEKARQLFKKYVNSNRKKGDTLSPSLTPAEISRRIGKLGSDTDAQVRALYEKARYGADTVDKSELDALGRLIK